MNPVSVFFTVYKSCKTAIDCRAKPLPLQIDLSTSARRSHVYISLARKKNTKKNKKKIFNLVNN